MKPTPLEKDILGKMIEALDYNEILREQVTKAAVTKREYTGVGFYTDFSVPESTEPIPTEKRTKSSLLEGPGVFISSSELPLDGGSVLWMEDGKIKCLEAFCYGDPAWPKRDLTDYEVKLNETEIQNQS